MEVLLAVWHSRRIVMTPTSVTSACGAFDSRKVCDGSRTRYPLRTKQLLCR